MSASAVPVARRGVPRRNVLTGPWTRGLVQTWRPCDPAEPRRVVTARARVCLSKAPCLCVSPYLDTRCVILIKLIQLMGVNVYLQSAPTTLAPSASGSWEKQEDSVCFSLALGGGHCHLGHGGQWGAVGEETRGPPHPPAHLGLPAAPWLTLGHAGRCPWAPACSRAAGTWAGAGPGLNIRGPPEDSISWHFPACVCPVLTLSRCERRVVSCGTARPPLPCVAALPCPLPTPPLLLPDAGLPVPGRMRWLWVWGGS